MHVGLDLGTSGIKAIAIDDNQRLLGEAHAPLGVQRPHSGWSEQLPSDWLKAVDDAMIRLKASVDLSAAKSIGLSGHMHGATMIDASGEVLGPCIMWNDTRSHSQAATMDANPRFRKISGNIVFPGFTAPKLAWMRENNPDVFDKVAKVLLPKDYIRFWLTGETISEMSDAAGTSWLDVGERNWSPELLEATGLSVEHMPSLVEGADASAGLSKSLAFQWGMKPGIPVAGGGGDNAATAVGVGVIKPGSAFLSLGTSGVVFAATANYSPAPETAVHTFCHAVPDTWHQMGVILSCADALSWYGKLVGKSAAELTGALSGVKAPGRALFMPYLGGERTPHNDATVRGALIGLENETDRAAGTRAIMEGVGFALRDNLDALAETGTKVDRLIAVGGGAQSRVWLETLATILNLPIDIPVAGDFGAAFGAARLGMMAATGDLDIATPPKIESSIQPSTAHTDAFNAAHLRYRETYTALRTLS